jgi:hypothetical protein
LAQAQIEAYAQAAREHQDQVASTHECSRQLVSAREEIHVLQGHLAFARAEFQALQGQSAQLAFARAELQALQGQSAQLASVRAELHVLQSQVAAFRALPTLRLRDALLKAPVVGPLLQASARRLASLLQ